MIFQDHHRNKVKLEDAITGQVVLVENSMLKKNNTSCMQANQASLT
jgi:hypothetical protein